AFEAVAREYERRNPGVQIVQIPIPEKIFRQWLTARLLGGDSPDIVEIGLGTTPEVLARYFVPLGEIAGRPNPYNVGTELEGVAFKDTFFDRMLGGFNPLLSEYYAVPLSAFTNRLMVNLDLLERVTGRRELPEKFEVFLEVCERLRREGVVDGERILPIVLSRSYAVNFMLWLFGSQTQRYLREIYPPGYMQAHAWLTTLLYARGKWSLEAEPVSRGMELMQRIGRVYPTGFLQLTREDATFQFLQRRALFLATGSWDAASLREQAGFAIGVMDLPFPEAGEGRFGEYALGQLSEAGLIGGLSLGVTRGSRNPKVAVDFLQFAASRFGNQVFAERSKMLPSVRGVKADPLVEGFEMRPEGYTQGFFLADRAQPDAIRAVSTNLHYLIEPNGSVERYADSLRLPLLQGYATDARRGIRSREIPIWRTEIQLGGMWMLSKLDPNNKEFEEKMDRMIAGLGMQYRLKALQGEVLRSVNVLLRKQRAAGFGGEEEFLSGGSDGRRGVSGLKLREGQENRRGGETT
ncbi:MAG: extracellular solute-binding protein, partial [Chthoniobacterales bacterium]|nr:extracellular solute-binding protein [Chthoniobacterales bacterium]